MNRYLVGIVASLSGCAGTPETECVVFAMSDDDDPVMVSLTVIDVAQPGSGYETLETPLEPGGTNIEDDPEYLDIGDWLIVADFEDGSSESTEVSCDEGEIWVVGVPYPFEIDPNRPIFD